jgi:hypothetical protein
MFLKERHLGNDAIESPSDDRGPQSTLKRQNCRITGLDPLEVARQRASRRENELCGHRRIHPVTPWIRLLVGKAKWMLHLELMSFGLVTQFSTTGPRLRNTGAVGIERRISDCHDNMDVGQGNRPSPTMIWVINLLLMLLRADPRD